MRKTIVAPVLCCRLFSAPLCAACRKMRSFVAMLQKPDNPWHLVQFISSQESIELATEEAQKAMRAAGVSEDDGDVATFEEEDEDEEEL